MALHCCFCNLETKNSNKEKGRFGLNQFHRILFLNRESKSPTKLLHRYQILRTKTHIHLDHISQNQPASISLFFFLFFVPWLNLDLGSHTQLWKEVLIRISKVVRCFRLLSDGAKIILFKSVVNCEKVRWRVIQELINMRKGAWTFKIKPKSCLIDHGYVKGNLH